MKYAGGKLTENGKFYEAALEYKQKIRKPEVVQVYEKISQGVWCNRGGFELIDAKILFDGTRNVFRFFLRPGKTPHAKEPFLKQTRVIPTAVKVEVWNRDQGCSITAKNVRLLCAKHNLEKSNKIMGFLPWFIGVA